MFSLSPSLESDPIVGVIQHDNFLSAKEIEVVHRRASMFLLEQAQIHTPKTNDPKGSLSREVDDALRQNHLVWLHPDHNDRPFSMVCHKIYARIMQINQENFKYALTDMEPFQYTSYNIGEYYKKHIDMGPKLEVGNTQRKISWSIQLSAPDQYQGGDLCLHPGEYTLTAEKTLGTLVVFPSWMLHQVTPVTSGRRISLVGWAWGPRFI